MTDTSKPLRNERTIHIDIPEEVSTDVADEFDEALSTFIFDQNWTDIAPFIHSHSEACEHSDHCYGPGSNVERAIARRAKAEALREMAERTIAEAVCCDEYEQFKASGKRPKHPHHICYWGAAHAEALLFRADQIEATP